jgi:hypothetical protein
MSIIYRKTAKGITEIDSRAHNLHPKLRSVLIMVDGHRSDQDLARFLAHAPESAQMLMEAGFIEVLMRTADGPPTVSGAALTQPARLTRPGGLTQPGTLAPAATLPPVASSFGGEVHVGFDARRRALLRAFNDQMGPAGESMAVRMERARTTEELRALLQPAVQMVGTVRGKIAADLFIKQIEALF